MRNIFNYEIDDLDQMFKWTKARAAKNNTPFLIDFQLVYRRYRKQNARCALTGIPFNHQTNSSWSRRPWAPSLDRIDSYHGYTKNNVRLVCVAVNLAMNEWGLKVFDTLARRYVAAQEGDVWKGVDPLALTKITEQLSALCGVNENPDPFS